MISFLNVDDSGVHGLGIPLSNVEVMDAKLASDTTLYLKVDLESVQKTKLALSIFCKALGALVKNPLHFGLGM